MVTIAYSSPQNKQPSFTSLPQPDSHPSKDPTCNLQSLTLHGDIWSGPASSSGTALREHHPLTAHSPRAYSPQQVNKDCGRRPCDLRVMQATRLCHEAGSESYLLVPGGVETSRAGREGASTSGACLEQCVQTQSNHRFLTAAGRSPALSRGSLRLRSPAACLEPQSAGFMTGAVGWRDTF